MGKIRTEGKTYDQVVGILKERGMNTEGVAVVALGPGLGSLILQKYEVIGEYVTRSKRVILYQDIIPKYPEN